MVDVDIQLYNDFLALQPGKKVRALAFKMMTLAAFDVAEETDVVAAQKEVARTPRRSRLRKSRRSQSAGTR